jgi:NADH:ubiquinone oxidoreductase subunit 2 (subunit N)
MPGSANFIGEFYILNGIFQEKIVFAFVAAIGIVLAAYYALRLFQHAMHNRKPDGIESREIGCARAPSSPAWSPASSASPSGRIDPASADDSVSSQLSSTDADADRGGAAMNFNAPHIDYAGLSPVIALTAGMVIVLMVGLFRWPRWVLPAKTIAVLAVTSGLAIWQWNEQHDLVAGALRLDAFGLAICLIACLAAAIVVVLSIREPAAEEAGYGAFYGLLLGSVLGMTLIAQAQNLIAFFVALELLSIPLYVLCASLAAPSARSSPASSTW